ncbi:MAG: cupredoxin domain-containing protein, partial [Blastococcus sp.]
IPRPALPRRALVALLIAAVVPLAGCAGKPPAAGATAASGSGAGASGAATQRLQITVAHGKASGNTGRVQVATGTAVTLVVTSDTADEVHLHGYDIEKELAPGKPTTLRFTADVPGVFEVELHKANLVILRLQVG